MSPRAPYPSLTAMQPNDNTLSHGTGAMHTSVSSKPALGQRLRTDRVRAARNLIFAAATFSFLFSIYLWFLVDRDKGLFVGLWVPSILSLGSMILRDKERAL